MSEHLATTASHHIERAIALITEAAGELYTASHRAPRVWVAELLELRRRLISLSADLAQALAFLAGH